MVVGTLLKGAKTLDRAWPPRALKKFEWRLLFDSGTPA
jgi:hypothetical protein